MSQGSLIALLKRRPGIPRAGPPLPAPATSGLQKPRGDSARAIVSDLGSSQLGAGAPGYGDRCPCLASPAMVSHWGAAAVTRRLRRIVKESGEPITGANALRLPRTHRYPAGRICRGEAPRPTPSDRPRHPIRAWGSRGRRFKSGRPDHCLAGQRPLRRVGEVASRSFDRRLTAGFSGILRHAAFMKSGERHI
jgi:hypothetical protein